MSLRFQIDHRPDFALLRVNLAPGEQIFAEPSAMATMDTTVALRSSMRGGLLTSLGRAMGGENLVMNTFSGERGGGEVTFAPGPLGDISHYALTGNTLFMQRGAFVAHSSGVQVTGKWEGARGFFGDTGLILLKAQGMGDVFFNTYGAVIEVDVRGDYFVDTGYVVAFEDTLNYRITVLPGLGLGARAKSFLFGGEGLVCRFNGQGKVWVQTRAVQPFLRWINPFRRVEKRQ